MMIELDELGEGNWKKLVERRAFIDISIGPLNFGLRFHNHVNTQEAEPERKSL